MTAAFTPASLAVCENLEMLRVAALQHPHTSMIAEQGIRTITYLHEAIEQIVRETHDSNNFHARRANGIACACLSRVATLQGGAR